MANAKDSFPNKDTSAIIFHQQVEEPLMIFLSLNLYILKKVFGLLQTLPTFGRFYHEGFACSHGYIAFLKV